MSRDEPIQILACFEMCAEHWKQTQDQQPMNAITSWINLDEDLSAPCSVGGCLKKAAIRGRAVVTFTKFVTEMS